MKIKVAPELGFAEIAEGFNDWIINIGFVFSDALSVCNDKTTSREQC